MDVDEPDPNGLGATGTLGQFLRSRRAHLSPEQVGLVSYGARRVPGLRREELAQLAGVSVTYYTRLEQGQSQNASASVIEALARALSLNDDERAHLYDLATTTQPPRRRPPRPETARPSTVRLITAMDDVAAVVMSRRTDVLAWNRLGHALLAGHCDQYAPARPSTRPNLTRLLFLNPHTRDLYPTWEQEAALAVASLRLVAGRYRGDPELSELVGELSLQSDEFARLWSSHPVRRCTSGTKGFRHPAVGVFTSEYSLFHLPDDSGQRLETFTPAPDQASTDAWRLLSTLTHPPAPTSPQREPPRAAEHRPTNASNPAVSDPSHSSP